MYASLFRPDQTRPDQTYNYAQNSDHEDREKILLVTLYGNFNYGNVFQRLALARVLESLGFDVDHLCSLNVLPKLTARQVFMRRTKTLFKKMLALVGIKKYLQREKEAAERALRLKSFESKIRVFQDMYITRKVFATRDEVLASRPERWDKYTFAVTGSDQVWHNWSRTPQELEYYYLSFMPQKKRVNYAPSFGFDEFLNDDYEIHQKGLSGFERLSSREREGCDMIREITGRDAEFVLDPTLLLNAEQWRKYESKPDFGNPGNLLERYIICYFLEAMPPAHVRAINAFAEGLPVINILNTYNEIEIPEFRNVKVTPSEILYLIDHADFICTNSFHGTAFSINFGKNFAAFRRFRLNGDSAGMFGRLESIMSAFGITGHIYQRFMNTRPNEPDYDLVRARLKAMRESSMKYLRECLKV